MVIKVLYEGCWTDLETKNFKTIQALEDFIKKATQTQLEEAATWPVSQTNIL